MLIKGLFWLVGIVAALLIGAALLEDQEIDSGVKDTFRILAGRAADSVDAPKALAAPEAEASGDGGDRDAYFLSYGADWSEDPTRRFDGRDGIQRISLTNDGARVSLTTTAMWGSDIDACIEDTRSGIPRWTNSSTAQPDSSHPAEPLDSGYAERAAVFAYTDLNDQTSRLVLVNCVWVPSSRLVPAILFDAPAAEFSAHLPARTRLLQHLNLN